jgi:hypothetical protein
VNWLYFLGGRTFVFIMCALGDATYLALHGKLTVEFGAVLVTLAGLFTARAVLDDVVNAKQPPPATAPQQ